MMKREQRWKKQKEPRRTENADQPSLLPETNLGSRKNGGWLWCLARGYQIDTAVCIVQQSREPRKCKGCAQLTKG